MSNYDFSHGTRGAIDPTPTTKTRITIRLDTDIIEWFRHQVEMAGGGNYQTLINDTLRQYIEAQKNEPLENVLRRVIREELADYKTS